MFRKSKRKELEKQNEVLEKLVRNLREKVEAQENLIEYYRQEWNVASHDRLYYRRNYELYKTAYERGVSINEVSLPPIIPGEQLENMKNQNNDLLKKMDIFYKRGEWK